MRRGARLKDRLHEAPWVWALPLLGGALLGFLILAYATAGLIYDYADTVELDNLPAVDAIVCLAGGKGRLQGAAELWNRYYVAHERDPNHPLPVLYFSGLGPRSNWSVVESQISSPEIVARLKKVQSTKVMLETQSGDTLENAIWARETAEVHRWNRLLIVTASYHMKRSMHLFESVFADREDTVFETWTIPSEAFTPENWRDDSYSIRVTLWEYLKWAYYFTFY